MTKLVKISDELHKRLKKEALERDITLEALVEEKLS